MQILHALVLGVVQGLTEFVPVSSSGHLVLLPALAGWPPPSLTMDVVLHLGTLGAMVAVFWRDLLALGAAWLRSLLRRNLDEETARTAWWLVLGMIPAGVLYWLLNDWIEELFGSPRWVAGLLLLTGTWLWLSDRIGRKWRSVETLGPWEALAIGIAQGVALAPGISRSGATMGAGLLLDLRRDAAARFSFLLAIPAIAGAGLVKAVGTLGSQSAHELAPAAVGFLAAAVSGYLSIRFLLSYLRTRTLRPFAVYCWVIGLGSLVWLLVR